MPFDEDPRAVLISIARIVLADMGIDRDEVVVPPPVREKLLPQPPGPVGMGRGSHDRVEDDDVGDERRVKAEVGAHILVFLGGIDEEEVDLPADEPRVEGVIGLRRERVAEDIRLLILA
jgi:hypothetical protein